MKFKILEYWHSGDDSMGNNDSDRGFASITPSKQENDMGSEILLDISRIEDKYMRKTTEYERIYYDINKKQKIYGKYFLTQTEYDDYKNDIERIQNIYNDLNLFVQTIFNNMKEPISNEAILIIKKMLNTKKLDDYDLQSYTNIFHYVFLTKNINLIELFLNNTKNKNFSNINGIETVYDQIKDILKKHGIDLLKDINDEKKFTFISYFIRHNEIENFKNAIKNIKFEDGDIINIFWEIFNMGDYFDSNMSKSKEDMVLELLDHCYNFEFQEKKSSPIVNKGDNILHFLFNNGDLSNWYNIVKKILKKANKNIMSMKNEINKSPFSMLLSSSENRTDISLIDLFLDICPDLINTLDNDIYLSKNSKLIKYLDTKIPNFLSKIESEKNNKFKNMSFFDLYCFNKGIQHRIDTFGQKTEYNIKEYNLTLDIIIEKIKNNDIGDLSEKDNNDNNIVNIICLNEDLDLLHLLISNGKINNNIINNKNGDGNFPLLEACCRNDLEIANLLLKNNGGKYINSHNNNNNYTPLYYACNNENNKLVRLLLSYGANTILQPINLLKLKRYNSEIFSLLNHFKDK